MVEPPVSEAIVQFIRQRTAAGELKSSAAQITAAVQISRPTINRHLAQLVSEGKLQRDGRGPGTRYQLPSGAPHPAPDLQSPSIAAAAASSALPWSAKALAIRDELTRPLAQRTPVTYRRDFVADYQPNETSLLPVSVAQDLFNAGRAQGQLPAGTYARKVLEQLLIDLSWHSSRLEGNRISLLDTEALFASGRSNSNNADATMLLNHKDAIVFLVDAVPEEGITVPVIRNLHSLLMNGLLADPNAVGAIRRRIVNIADSVYLPAQVPAFLEDMLNLIVDKARQIKNPIEAAFFLWINIAYLQPFEDGNKRTSRLSANLPLILNNCAPLSFLDVSVPDYAFAMMAVYEKQDVTMATELFEWTYRRSIIKYKVIQDSMATPDPFRATYRMQLGETVRRVVLGEPLNSVVGSLDIPVDTRSTFLSMAQNDLEHLQPYNCARFQLSIPYVDRWIKAGRPGI